MLLSDVGSFHTDLVKIIRGHLLEGLESTKGIKAELYKPDTYGKYLTFVRPYLVPSCYLAFFKPHVDTLRNEKKCLGHSLSSFRRSMRVELSPFGTTVTNGSSTLDERLRTSTNQTIGYVAFFSDIEHDVAPVT